jgi:hypothetical protein
LREAATQTPDEYWRLGDVAIGDIEIGDIDLVTSLLGNGDEGAGGARILNWQILNVGRVTLTLWPARLSTVESFRGVSDPKVTHQVFWATLGGCPHGTLGAAPVERGGSYHPNTLPDAPQTPPRPPQTSAGTGNPQTNPEIAKGPPTHARRAIGGPNPSKPLKGTDEQQRQGS